MECRLPQKYLGSVGFPLNMMPLDVVNDGMDSKEIKKGLRNQWYFVRNDRFFIMNSNTQPPRLWTFVPVLSQRVKVGERVEKGGGKTMQKGK